MSVIENAFAWLCGVRKREEIILIPAEVELLAVVARIVVHRMNYRAIAPDKPVGGAQSMLHCHVAIFRISTLLACPPQKLKVHHRINDAVIAISIPCGNQLRDRVKHLHQMISATHGAIAQPGIASQFESPGGRIVIKKPGVMVLIDLFAYKARGPEFCPATIFGIVSVSVHLPELARPETTGPETSVLRLPFPGLIVPVSKESFSDIVVYGGSRCS